MLAADFYGRLYYDYEHHTGRSVPGGLRALVAFQSIGQALKHCAVSFPSPPGHLQLDPSGWQWNLFRLTCCCRFSEQEWHFHRPSDMPEVRRRFVYPPQWANGTALHVQCARAVLGTGQTSYVWEAAARQRWRL